MYENNIQVFKAQHVTRRYITEGIMWFSKTFKGLKETLNKQHYIDEMTTHTHTHPNN